MSLLGGVAHGWYLDYKWKYVPPLSLFLPLCSAMLAEFPSWLGGQKNARSDVVVDVAKIFNFKHPLKTCNCVGVWECVFVQAEGCFCSRTFCVLVKVQLSSNPTSWKLSSTGYECTTCRTINWHAFCSISTEIHECISVKKKVFLVPVLTPSACFISDLSTCGIMT